MSPLRKPCAVEVAVAVLGVYLHPASDVVPLTAAAVATVKVLVVGTSTTGTIVPFNPV